MTQDENTVETQDEITEGQAGTVEETESGQGEGESQSGSSELTVAEKLAKAEAEAAKYRRLFEKGQKPKTETSVAPRQATSQPSVEETILLANGTSEELIEELKLRAPKYGGSLIKAQKDPNFVAVKERFEKEKKSKDASLGASRGAGGAKVEKSTLTPNLSRDEHMAMAKNFS